MALLRPGSAPSTRQEDECAPCAAVAAKSGQGGGSAAEHNVRYSNDKRVFYVSSSSRAIVELKAMRGFNSLSAAALALLSCTPLPRESSSKPPSALPVGAVPPGAPATEWSRKTRPERMEFMGLFFFPKMKRIFQSHDQRDAVPFRCQSCHGRDMEAADFRMPNGLYALPADEPEKAALVRDEKMARFMVEEVVPAAKELLGLDLSAGRACHLCHENE
jgi:hypothetical protein